MTGWRVVDPMIKDRMLISLQGTRPISQMIPETTERGTSSTQKWVGRGYGTVPRITYVKSCSKNLQIFTVLRICYVSWKSIVCPKKEGYD